MTDALTIVHPTAASVYASKNCSVVGRDVVTDLCPVSAADTSSN